MGNCRSYFQNGNHKFHAKLRYGYSSLLWYLLQVIPEPSTVQVVENNYCTISASSSVIPNLLSVDWTIVSNSYENWLLKYLQHGYFTVNINILPEPQINIMTSLLYKCGPIYHIERGVHLWNTSHSFWAEVQSLSIYATCLNLIIFRWMILADFVFRTSSYLVWN